MKRHEETTSTKNLNSFCSAFRKVLVVTCRKGKRVLVPSAYFHTQSGLSQLQPRHAVQTQASPLSWPPGKFASHIRLSKGSQESSLRHLSKLFNTINRDIPTQHRWCCQYVHHCTIPIGLKVRTSFSLDRWRFKCVPRAQIQMYKGINWGLKEVQYQQFTSLPL